MHAEELAIATEQLTFRYGSRPVLTDVRLSVPTGAYLGVLGPNGGGKTTLLKLILGLLQPTAGTVQVFGAAPNVARANGVIGYVPQHVARADFQFPATVREVVLSGRVAKRGLFLRLNAADHAAAEEAMRRTDTLQHADTLITNLSGGETQRAFIARALCSEPRLLVLDEPTSGVDMAARSQLYQLLKELNAAGLTIMFVSHDLEVMTRHATSVACLNEKLLCCCSSHRFLESNLLQDLYGKDVSFLQHVH